MLDLRSMASSRVPTRASHFASRQTSEVYQQLLTRASYPPAFCPRWVREASGGKIPGQHEREREVLSSTSNIKSRHRTPAGSQSILSCIIDEESISYFVTIELQVLQSSRRPQPQICSDLGPLGYWDAWNWEQQIEIKKPSRKMSSDYQPIYYKVEMKVVVWTCRKLWLRMGLKFGWLDED
jgi:hypothetical protein